MVPKDQTSTINSEFLKALNTVSSLLRQSIHTEVEVYRIFREQMQALGLRGGLGLLDDDREIMTFQVVSSHDGLITSLGDQLNISLEGYTFRVADVEVYHQVVTTGEPVFVRNATPIVVQMMPDNLDFLVDQVTDMMGKHPAIFAPLIVEGEVQGTINIAGADLSENDVPAIIALADYLAASLNNAQLFQAVRQAETMYRRLFESAIDGFILIDPENGRILSANPSLQKMTGYTRDELAGMGIIDLQPPEVRAERLETLRYIRKHKQHFFETPLLQADGRSIMVQISASIFKINGREIMQGVIRDVTAQKAAEEALQSVNLALTTSRDALHRLIQQTPVSILVFGPDGICHDLNQAALEMFGVANRDRIVGRFSILHSRLTREGAAGISKGAHRALAGEVVRLGDLTVDFATLDTDFGRSIGKRILNITLFPVSGEQGGIANVVSMVQDVTEQKETELLQSILYRIAALAGLDLSLKELYPKIRHIISDLMDVENFYIALYDAETDMISLPYFVDAEDRYEGPYPAGKGLSEHVIRTGEALLIDWEEHQRLIDAGVLDLIGPPAQIWLGAPLQAQGKPFGAVVVQHYEDERAYTERDKQLLEFVSGQIGLAIERKRAEADLKALAAEMEQQAETLDVILSTTPNAFYIFDREGRHLYASPTALATMGLTLEDVVGKSLTELGFPVPAKFMPELTAVFDSGQPISSETQQVIGDQTHYFEYTLTPVKNRAHEVVSVVSTSRDVTEQRQAQEALWHRQRIESLGVLAGGVAHDFNNLLVAMLGQSSLALAKLPAESAARPHIEKGMKAAERAADLTRQLLAYSGRGQFAMRTIDLNALIRENDHLLQVSIPKNVQLRLDLTEPLPSIEADSGQMQQIIMNLILNAAEAIEERPGTIMVTTDVRSMASVDEAYWQVTGQSLPPGDYVVLDVTDNGSGMGEETAGHIFDPFFTTKFTGRGLGLAAVLGIVRGHKGGLRVTSQPDIGTTFELIFPVVDAQPLAAEVESDTVNPPALSGYVLVIDDEAPVREAVTDILEMEGVDVIIASDGQRGIELYQQRQDEIELVLLDLSMPGLSGKETFVRLREIDPDLKIVLSSGYTATEVTRQFEGLTVTGFIQKPYDLLKLVNDVAHFLAL